MTALIATEEKEAIDYVTIQIKDIEQEGNSGFFMGENWNLDVVIQRPHYQREFMCLMMKITKCMAV